MEHQGRLERFIRRIGFHLRVLTSINPLAEQTSPRVRIIFQNDPFEQAVTHLRTDPRIAGISGQIALFVGMIAVWAQLIPQL